MAKRADMAARRYVLIEKLEKASTADEYLRLFNQLDILDHQLECISARKKMNDSGEKLLRYRRNRMLKEKRFQITQR